MFFGSIKHNVTITKTELSFVSFAPHSRIFLVHRFPPLERQFEIEQRL